LPPDGEGPLYRQLADLILAEIERGALPPDSSLPTVRELAEEMKLSNGTIKHAYDELERLGVIEKVRGRGTFVRMRDDGESQGKKDRAMQIISRMMEEMRELGFSLRDTRIFFDLKMREQEDRPRCARVMVIDCNPEALHMISGQIARIRGAEVISRFLDDLPGSADLQAEAPDLVVTTANHYEQVLRYAAREEIVSRVALSPSSSAVASLAKAGNGGRIGILTASERFMRIIREVRAKLVAGAAEIPCMLFGGNDVDEFLCTLDTVIVPDQYARFCSQREITAMRAFQESGGSVIEFTYHIDDGSLMYLEQRIASVLANK